MEYIEDVLTEIAVKYIDYLSVSNQDYLVLTSFYNIYNRGDTLTKNQAQLLLKILKRNRINFQIAGLDYQKQLENPLWKSNFRVLDYSKKVYVVDGEDGLPWVCLKFPYNLKDDFDHFSKKQQLSSKWLPTDRVRKFVLYDCNLLSLYEFILEHRFDIDESFLEYFSNYEEILNQQENIIPYCTIENNTVNLVNATEQAIEWFSKNKTDNIDNNLLLAKSMGFKLLSPPTSTVEKIAASETNTFWFKSTEKFLTTLKQLSGKFVFILDRAYNNIEFLKEFISVAEELGFSPEEIKICFRFNSSEDKKFNSWVKENGHGGPVDQGKILIFNHKPAKWIFKNSIDVRVVGTNSVYTPTDVLTRTWFESHPCVCYVNSIKPSSKTKDNKIAYL